MLQAARGPVCSFPPVSVQACNSKPSLLLPPATAPRPAAPAPTVPCPAAAATAVPTTPAWQAAQSVLVKLQALLWASMPRPLQLQCGRFDTPATTLVNPYWYNQHSSSSSSA